VKTLRHLRRSLVAGSIDINGKPSSDAASIRKTDNSLTGRAWRKDVTESPESEESLAKTAKRSPNTSYKTRYRNLDPSLPAGHPSSAKLSDNLLRKIRNMIICSVNQYCASAWP
jgi:hypothetical protein